MAIGRRTHALLGGFDVGFELGLWCNLAGMPDWTDWPIVLIGCAVFALALNAVLWVAVKVSNWWRKR